MMIRPFLRFAESTYFLLRVFAGFLFSAHGAQKLFGVLGSEGAQNALMYVAGVVEFFGGLAIALGLFTQIAAFLAAGQMAVAYLMAHAGQGFWPILNRGEMALLYLFIFLYVMTRGPGRWGADNLLFAEKRVEGPTGF